MSLGLKVFSVSSSWVSTFKFDLMNRLHFDNNKCSKMICIWKSL